MDPQPRNPKQQKLKMCYLNANGIYRQKTSLLNFIVKHHMQFMLINESWLTNNRVLHVSSYQVCSTNRTDNNGGGTAIIINNNIPHQHVPSPTTTALKTTAITVKIRSIPITIVSDYRPPKNNPSFKTDITNLLRIFY